MINENQMKAWTQMYQNVFESEAEETIDEQTAQKEYAVTPKYISAAVKALQPLKSANQADFESAVEFLKSFQAQNKKLKVSPEAFAAAQMKQSQSLNKSAGSAEDMIKRVGHDKSVEYADIEASKQIKHMIKSIHVIQFVGENTIEFEIEKADGEKIHDKIEIPTPQGFRQYVKASMMPKDTEEDKAKRRQALAAARSVIKDEDPLFISCWQGIKATQLAKQTPITLRDIKLCVFRAGFTDHQIKWYFGPNKKPDQYWAFARQATKTVDSPAVQKEPKPPQLETILVKIADYGRTASGSHVSLYQQVQREKPARGRRGIKLFEDDFEEDESLNETMEYDGSDINKKAHTVGEFVKWLHSIGAADSDKIYIGSKVSISFDGGLVIYAY